MTKQIVDGGNPFEMRNRMRDFVGTLRLVIQKSAKSRTEVGEYVAHLEDRLDAFARVHGGLDANGETSLHRIVVDELWFYCASEGEQFSLSGPNLLLQPRAAQVLALAVHELAVNAVEHGPLMSGNEVIEIKCSVDGPSDEPIYSFAWKESGPRRPFEIIRRGFGLDILQNTVGTELAAETTLAFEGDGLRYSMRFPLGTEIGRLEPESAASPIC